MPASRVHGDVLEINPAEGGDKILRVEFSAMGIDRITQIDAISRKAICTLEHIEVSSPHPTM